MLENFGIGTDIEDINRFENLCLEKDSKFLRKIFTETLLKTKTKQYGSHRITD